ncbi:hypothetical protein CKALI_10785 [Corynebacterium kalinowskii]|uniref:Type II secretion system protein GspF domain-containing protein n=1 Tax=Corynebacterium kalinowskii TaxID=2675216 RepID=A0A6B8VTR2_9CORY|nr:type II secretion system F family protein [Corynebacterium kalinowskii]QGU03007.1 hypothetical protein CKALI_10785 [Corynebacterium kalinowskii]
MISLSIASLALWLHPSPQITGRIEDLTEPHVRARDGPHSSLDCAADIELYAACLASGVTPALAASTAAEVSVVAPTQWSSVAAMLTLGSPAATAWSPMVGLPHLEELARVAKFSQYTGSSLVRSCEDIATDLRARSAEEATAAAERAGVFIALPLALCFLPAFLVLGLLPIVINLATQHFT